MSRKRVAFERVKDVAQLKSLLRKTTGAKLGSFGETIYRIFVSKKGHAIKSLHRRRADFSVQALGRVDVKTKGIGSKTRRIKVREPDTIYCFVDLFEEYITLTHEDASGRSVQPEESIEWNDALADWNDQEKFPLNSEKDDVDAEIKRQTDELKHWISENWQLKAAVVYREGPSTQESMEAGNEPWGPNTFHESPKARRKIDVKVLAYFDRTQMYRLMAYPIRLREEVHWTRDRASKEKRSFDPKTIDPKFVFENLADFRLNFPKRFL